MHSATLLRRSALIPIVALVIALSACVPEAADEDPGASGSPSSTPTTTPSPTPTATTAPEVVYEPVEIACDALISAQAMYDYNPNTSFIGEYTPVAGSVGERVAERNGTTCQWVNASSGVTIDLGVAQLPEPQLTELKNETVGSSNSVPTYGVEGYFHQEGGVGVAQAFSGQYWIVLSSSGFLEPGDVTPLVATIIAALG